MPSPVITGLARESDSGKQGDNATAAPAPILDVDPVIGEEERAKLEKLAKAEANKKQPPDGKNVGLDSDKAGGGKGGDVDVLRLSQDKFAKLDEETKAKLRGDVI